MSWSYLLKARKTVFKALQLILSLNWGNKELRSNEISIALEHAEKGIRELLAAIDLYL